ncbi:hypothetical protein QBC38DRAFT_518253 [Podospora fimiseda]|uniref:Uncharacterized protein n=1 Tax=Podospora fimiseda TaxID=252190 RepID=A0AAN7BEH0_9PEZI|nr:hypothetical protein QBC38DRAFT_518253 [Podospora fimiseda]
MKSQDAWAIEERACLACLACLAWLFIQRTIWTQRPRPSPRVLGMAHDYQRKGQADFQESGRDEHKTANGPRGREGVIFHFPHKIFPRLRFPLLSSLHVFFSFVYFHRRRRRRRRRGRRGRRGIAHPQKSWKSPLNFRKLATK